MDAYRTTAIELPQIFNLNTVIQPLKSFQKKKLFAIIIHITKYSLQKIKTIFITLHT